MKISIIVFFMSITLPLLGHCAVYKCKLPSGKVVYQSEPCQAEAKTEGVVRVKEMTPEEKETARARLQSWQAQQAAEDAAKAEAERQRQEELQKQESLELQRRSVEAQEQQAISAQQQQLQQQQMGNRWYGGGLYGPYSPYAPGYGSGYNPYPDHYHPGNYPIPNHHGYPGKYHPPPPGYNNFQPYDPHKPQQIQPKYQLR
jgi:hypothetical protein